MVYIVRPEVMRRIKNDKKLVEILGGVTRKPLSIHGIAVDHRTGNYRVWDGGDYTEVCFEDNFE